MGVDHILFCLKTAESITIRRRDRAASARDGWFLLEEADTLDCALGWDDLRVRNAHLMTPTAFDNGRINAADALEESDVDVGRWHNEKAWCLERWERDHHVVAFGDNTEARNFFLSHHDPSMLPRRCTE